MYKRQNEDGTLVVVFNGEIYNYKTLRARLQQRGHTFATDSDTEVLLHGYEEWGRGLPCRLRGMFAFAVWDRTRGTLFCARDLFGIKPLCYYKKGETLLFASEIKAFLAHPAFEKRLNEARLPDWLSMEYLPDAETLFTGVYELPPAHTLTWQAGRVTLARYAAPRFRAKRGRSLQAWAREIGDAVAESADAHRIADVEVGCFLSGGVDSSLITCEMARRQPAVQCFSVGYAEKAYSELPAARAAAQALGVPLTETTVTAEDFFAANRAIQWYLDEPMPNPAEVPLYFLCKAARQRVKVVLSGEGADELFGGYPLYRQAVWAERWQKMPRAVRRALAALLPGCGLLHRGALPRWQRSARANYVFETTQERDKYLKRDYCAPTPAQRCKPYFDAVRGLDEPTAVQWVDWQTWLPRDILRKADRMSMAHSLELRVPFLDRQVLAAAQALPRRYRCTGRRGKIALRAAAARRGLTDRVIFAGVQSDVPAFMNAFDLFLLPSNFEGSPVTLVEAQGCGVPCLASTNVPDDGSVTDLVHFLPLAAPLTDWAAKAEAIAAHGDHDDHWAALSAAGYELKTAARRMEQLYDKLGGHA